MSSLKISNTGSFLINRGKTPHRQVYRNGHNVTPTTLTPNGNGSNGCHITSQNGNHRSTLTTLQIIEGEEGLSLENGNSVSSEELPGLLDSLSSLIPCDSEHGFHYYFSNLEDSRRILEGVDQIWRCGRLFDLQNDQTICNDLLNLLSLIVHSETLKSALTRNNDDNFVLEFNTTIRKRNFLPFQKAICLMQALELALLGVSPTRILSRINAAKIKEDSRNNASGYINELQAGWYLAKFLFKFEMFRGGKLILSKNFRQKEVDIEAPGVLGEIKSTGNGLNQQIKELIKMILGDSNLRKAINKIIIVKNATTTEQYSPDFLDTKEYNDLKQILIRSLEETFRAEGNNLSSVESECLNGLLSETGIEIFFTPHYDDFNAIKSWIEQNYEVLDRETALAA